MTTNQPIPFVKLEALGNSYIVVDPKHKKYWARKDVVRWCSEDWGVGADGILWGPFFDSDIAPPKVVIYNSDGSTAEKSGNGLRIFSKYLWDKEIVNGNPFQILTEVGPVESKVFKSGQIEIAMGKASIVKELKETLTVEKNGESIMAEMTRVNIGNPHCCVFGGFPTLDSVKQWGSALENNALFPRRTNVQFAKVLEKDKLEVQVWERGSGYTLASGSSASAVAFAAYKRGLVHEEVTVHMPGGDLYIRINPETDEVSLRGAVEWICDGQWLKGELPKEENEISDADRQFGGVE